MIPEEAIKELREASDSEVRYGDTERHYNEVMKRVEAFDMAIKALEEVSRLPENLHREREQAYMNGYADGKSICRWISVDDKLPEENHRVLVIYRPLISDTEKIDIDFIKGKYWQNHGGVIAWMPLPEWEGMEYDEECKTMKIKKSAYDDAIERIDKSTFTLNDGLDCVETLVAFEAVMIASRTSQQKIGHWIDDKCSVCGKGIEDLISSSEWYRNEEPNFCPFCGARLEVEDEADN